MRATTFISVSAGLPPSTPSKRLVISPGVRTWVSWDSDIGVICIAFHSSGCGGANRQKCGGSGRGESGVRRKERKEDFEIGRTRVGLRSADRVRSYHQRAGCAG